MIIGYIHLFSQGTTTVNITGIPPILPSPFVHDIENNYNQGQYQMQMTYTNPANPNPVEFVYEISLIKDGEEIIHAVSDPVSYTPGSYTYQSFDEEPRIRFSSGFLDELDSEMYEQVIRTGVLPEASYVLEVEVLPFDPFDDIISIPASVFFEIRLPQPPILISPMDETTIPPVYSVFSWTPVIGLPGLQFEYELLIVEVYPNQTPEQAIDANYEHFLITTQQPLFIYTHDELPLEVGSTYAWMVTAGEVNNEIPLSDEGKSEIYTFTVQETLVDFDFDEIESIQLIPGFAEIINLDQLDVDVQQNSAILNGFATLRLDSPADLGIVDINITCFDLEIPLLDITNPIAFGGEVTGSIDAATLPLEGVGEVINLETIQWTIMQSLTVEASVIDPTGQYIEATGMLSLQQDGLSGMITATGPGGTPLLELGDDPFELIINGLTATFPGAYMALDAQVKFFDNPTPCQVNDVFNLDESVASLDFFCSIDQNIALIPGEDLLTLFLSSASGEISFDWSQSSIDFVASVNGAIQIDAFGDETYDIPMGVSLSSTEGLSFEIWPPSIIINPPPIELGIAELTIIRFENAFLEYDPATTDWDFGFDMDAKLNLPGLDDLNLGSLTGLSIDSEGITFPEVNLSEQDLAFIPTLELAGFGARLTAFNMPSFTFQWFDWDGMTPGPWDFTFDFEFTTPNFGNHLPSCLRNLAFDIQDASFSGGVLTAELPSTDFQHGECSFQLGAGYHLHINQLSGGIFGEVAAGDFELDGYISLDAAMQLGSPFDCSDGSDITLDAENLTIQGNGIFLGEFTNIIPACPLKIGPYTAAITESVLRFGHNENSQTATFEASAFLEFPTQDGGTNQVEGQVGINLITGDFYELDFQITDPFVWVIPQDEEVLRFNISQASISLDGLFIDGSQEFVAGDQTISVAINQLLLDMKSFSIKSGSIEFAEGFAFQAGIDPQELSLTYGSVPLNSDLELDPGIMFNLSGEIRMDSLGLHASGTADAQLKFAGFEIDDISVTFTDDFAFGLNPFKVDNGHIDIQYQNQTIAIIDEFGFHPSFAFFNLEDVLPAHLPLPKHSIAYLVLKDDDDELLIDLEQDPENDFAVIISSKPNQPVEFVFPVLQGDHAAPPSLAVEFSNITLSLSPLQFESGEIHVSVPDHDEMFDLSQYGIPMSLKQISYGEFDFETLFLEGLFLSGELVLFDEELGDQATFSMYVGSDGSLNTSLDINNINAQIPLVPGSNIAILSVESITGWAQFHLLQPGLPEFMFEIDGGFEISADEQHSARADVSMEYTRQGILIQDFEYDITGEKPKIDIDPFIFKVNEIKALDLTYDDNEGFDFYAQLDFAFGMRFDDNDTLLIPLQGVEIRPTGFVIPAQEINDGSEPPLQVPPVSILGFELQPLAFRTFDVIVNVFDFSPGDLAGLIPRMDFSLVFPGLTELAPQLEGLSLTVLDAGFQNGHFTGSIEVHEPLQPIKVPLGETEMEILELAGDLYEKTQDGITRQAIDVTIEGNIPAIHQFETVEPCDPIAFTLMIVEGSGFAGSIENIVPCGAIPLGSMGLSFTSSSLELDFMEGVQSAILTGAAVLNIPRDDQPDLDISGELSMDLLSGNILDGAIEIADAFLWHFPADAEDPFISFTVQQARLDSLGLTLKAQGSMRITEEVNVDVAFDDLVIQLSDLTIADGQASISSGFAFDLMFLPVQWQLTALNQAMPEDVNVIRMNFEDVGMTLDKDGLAFTGEASAKVSLPDMPDFPHDDDPDDPEDPEDPEDDDKFFDNLRLVFIDNFRMHMPPQSVAKSGRAEIWLDEEDDSTLLAWYDTDGIGLGDFLGLLPIPDTLGLPTKDIAYMVLKDEDGNLLVELDIDGGERTLQTKAGEAVDIVIAGLTDEEGNNPGFSTSFSITVNDAFEIVDGSISVNLDDNQFGNQPFKVPEFPLTLTGLTYERRENGVGALTASALLDLPESLNEIQVSIDELRFSQEGFEQASFSIGNEDFDDDDDPQITHSFADDALIFNLHYARAAFGETNEFLMKGTFQSSFFMDEEAETYSSLPFDAGYAQTDNPGGAWSFSLGLSYTDTLEVSYARFAITQFEALATQEEFSLIMSGIISLPELLGDDFAITIEELSLGTAGISVGSISADAQEQEFFFFDERLRVLVSSITPDYDSQQQVLYVSMGGELEVLGREIIFSNMTIGTDGSFSIGEGIDVNLLTEELVILEDHLVVEQLLLGITDENKLRMGVTGNVTLPEPFDESSGFSIFVVQTDRFNVDISVEGPGFQMGDGFEISDDRTQVALGDFATLDLTAVAVDIDFKNISNTTFFATAAVYLENDVEKRIEFGQAANIYDQWGFRFNYNDGFQWNITSTPSGNNPLFTFDAGFFGISIHALATYNSGFGVEIGGKVSLLLPQVTGEANFSGFRINKSGIEDMGQFDGGVSFTLMDKVSLSLGDFEYAPDGGVLTLEVEGEDTTMEDPVIETININTKRHLRISEANITINGAGNGNGGGFDSFAGGVDEVLFYISQEDELHLYIDNAFLEMGDMASIWVSMRYITADDFFHLSVAGAGEFKTEGVGAGLAVAGKIEKTGSDISFGLFVKADVSPGIPLIPGIITLNGAGGGFYYRPSEDDFDMVRAAAGLTYLETPEYNSNITFAAFLYAGLGLVGTDPYYVEGTFFIEATDQFTSLYANGLLMGQPEDNLFANLYLNVDYGDSPNVQGLVRVDVSYTPVVTGTGQIGFFAQSTEAEVIWAIYGNKSLQILGAVNMDSDFIVCNDGLLITTELGVDVSGWWGSVEGGIEAGIWYIVDSGFGAYGEISANVTVFGVSVGGDLYAAYVSQHSLFYAAGSVYVDAFLISGDVDVWVAYQAGSWDGGRGSNEYAALIDQARQEAESMADAAEQASDQVSAAQEALAEAAHIEDLINEVMDIVDDMNSINNQRTTMENKIAYVNQMAPAVVDRLDNAIIQAIELQEEVQMFAQQLENPITFNEGTLSGQDDDLVVLDNPSIGLDQAKADGNQDKIEEYQDNMAEQLAYYEEVITQALTNLTELEMIIDGSPSFAGGLLSGFNIVFDYDLVIPVNPVSFDFFDPILPPGFGPMPSGPNPSFDYSVSGPQFGGFGGLGGGTAVSFNHLAESYTEAVEAVKRFYAVYASTLWFMHLVYAIAEEDDYVTAILLAIAISDEQYEEILPPLIENHAAFTESIDLLYTIKGQMITTIYGMLEAYAILLENTMDDEELAEVQNMQIEMAEKMEPPVISSFIINPNYFLWRNRADIEWVAQHPDQVVETSYAIQDVGIGPFTSAGNLQSLKHFTYKRDLDEIQRNYTVALRARGSGGNTAIRMANITLKVDGPGQNSPGGEQLPDEVPPPSTPFVTLPYNYTTFGMFGQFRTYYTNNQSSIDLTISAHSEYSDITTFAYALGTSLGSTNILDWTTAVGVIEPVNVGEGGITRQISTSISGLNLEHNAKYYISARAYDADGNFSQVNMAHGILYDSTPPSKPELSIALPLNPWFWPPPPPVYPQVASIPDWIEGKFNYPQGFDIATFNIEYDESEDPESGIKNYEYVLTSVADPQTAFQNDSDVQITTDTEINLAAWPEGNDLISFTDSLYLHIRARNRAGTAGEVLTIDPAIAKDPTRPTRPQARIRVLSNSLRLYLPYLSLDAESQTIGYQYSIGTAPGSTDVAGWGDGVDIEQTEQLIVNPGIGFWYVTSEPTHVPTHNIPKTGLPEQTNLYVNVRAVNGQNMKSLPVVTGPFQVGTYPEEPDVTLSYDSDEGRLYMHINNIFDAGAPISSGSYRIKNNDTGQFLSATPVPIFGIAGLYDQPGSITRNASVPESESGYTVYINITNSAFNTTSVTETFTHPIGWFPPVFIPPLNF